MSMTESEAKLMLLTIIDVANNSDECNSVEIDAFYEEALSVGVNALEEIQQYRAIGTVSELRELKEKATAKKPIDRIMFEECPNCGAVDIANCGFCPECGQKLDWSEEKE